LILGPGASTSSSNGVKDSNSSYHGSGNGASSSNHPAMTPTSAFLATYEREARSLEEAAGGAPNKAEREGEEAQPRIEVPRVGAVPRVEWTVPSPRVRPPPPTAPLPSTSTHTGINSTSANGAASAGADVETHATSSASSSDHALAWASAQVRAAVRSCRANSASNGHGDPPVDQLLPLFPYLSNEAQKLVMWQLVLQYKVTHAQTDNKSIGPPSINTRSSHTPQGNHRGNAAINGSASGGRITSSRHRAISPNRSLSSGYAPSPRQQQQPPLVPPWGGSSALASSNGYGGADNGNKFQNMGNNSTNSRSNYSNGSGAGTPLHAAAAAVEPFELRSSADVAKLFGSSEDVYAMNDAELAKLWAISPTAASSSANATPTMSHFVVPPPPTSSSSRHHHSSSSSPHTRSSNPRSQRQMLPPPPTSNYTNAVLSLSSRAAPPTLARVQARAAAEGGGVGGGGGRGLGSAMMTTPRGGSRLGSDRDSESVATFNSDDMLASLGGDEDIWGGEFS